MFGWMAGKHLQCIKARDLNGQEHGRGPQGPGSRQTGGSPRGSAVGGSAAAQRAHGGDALNPGGKEERVGPHIPCVRTQPTNRRPRCAGEGEPCLRLAYSLSG